MFKILAVIDSEIQDALSANDIYVGAEWEFLLKRESITEGAHAVSLLEKACESSINIDPWLKNQAHTL